MMRAKLKRLTDAALPRALKDLSREELLDAVRKAWGPEATLDDYTRFVTRWRRLQPHGVWLAEWVVTYGTFPLPPNRDDIDALDIAQPYAHALRVRVQVEASAIASGGVGSEAYYSTYTGGDMKEARRFRHEAMAVRQLR